MGGGETALLSYIFQEGRDTSTEEYRPVPPSCPPLLLLTAADLGAGAKADAAKVEKSENTAGN